MMGEKMKFKWKEGLVGIVVYNETEDSFQLEQKYVDVGLCEPLWQDFEGKKVKITIEVLN
jgi:hypothetical protein